MSFNIPNCSLNISSGVIQLEKVNNFKFNVLYNLQDTSKIGTITYTNCQNLLISGNNNQIFGIPSVSIIIQGNNNNIINSNNRINKFN
jgi:hypothetical protein